MAPKDNKLQKSGVIFKFICQHINCPEKYIGESGREFGDKGKEHLRAASPKTTGHPVSPDCFTTVHREQQETLRRLWTSR